MQIDIKDYRDKIREVIEEQRQYRRITLRGLAKAVHISQPYLSQILLRQRDTSILLLLDLLETLGYTINIIPLTQAKEQILVLEDIPPLRPHSAATSDIVA